MDDTQLLFTHLGHARVTCAKPGIIATGTHLAEDFEEGGFRHILGEVAHVQRGGVVRGDLKQSRRREQPGNASHMNNCQDGGIILVGSDVLSEKINTSDGVEAKAPSPATETL